MEQLTPVIHKFATVLRERDEAREENEALNAKLAVADPLACLLWNLEATERILARATEEDLSDHDLDRARAALADARLAAGRLSGLVPTRPPVSRSQRPSVAPRISAVALARQSILIIDDDPQVGNSLARALAEHSVVVVTAGADALALLARGVRFDLVLCDAMLPTMTGAQLFDELCARHPEQAARMVFMIGSALSTEVSNALLTSPAPQLSKPFTMAALHAVMAGL